MSHLLRKYNELFLDHDGAIIQVDGINYKLRASTWMQRYPYKARVISVHADPVNKGAKHYRETKRELGDDWSVSVLDSFEFECKVREALSSKEAA